MNWLSFVVLTLLVALFAYAGGYQAGRADEQDWQQPARGEREDLL